MINKEFAKIIHDSLNNYKESDDKHKKIITRQIVRTAEAYIQHGLNIDEWILAFKDEPIVLSELNKINQIPILNEILELVKEIFPKEIKYITILQETCGWEQYTLDVEFYDENWNLIDMPIDDFSAIEQEKFGESCLSDFIHNSLIGMSSIDFKSPDFDFKTNHKYTYKVW